MATRTFSLQNTILDGSGNPIVGRAITATLLIPGGVPAVDTDANAVIPDAVSTVTNNTGAYAITLIYPGDVSPAGCVWSINEAGTTVLSPPDFSYASTIATWAWYPGGGTTGTLACSLFVVKGNNAPVSGRYVHITPAQNAIDPNSVLVSVFTPVDALIDGSGRALFWLWPSSVLAPATSYTCRIDGETTRIIFNVPTTPTGFQGAYDGSTAYAVRDGSSYEGPYTPTLNPPDVVLYNGLYYSCIADTTGNLPTNATYWAAWIAEPITWHQTVAITPGSIAISADNVAPASGVTPISGAPYPTPASLTQDILDLQYAAQHTVPAYTWATKSANYTATSTDRGLLVDATSGNLTITLPTAVGATARYAIKKKDSSTHTVTIATTSAQTIDGASTKVISTQNAGYEVYSDGTNWYVAAIPLASGGASFAWSTKTANYTVTTSDSGILADATSGNLTMTLPTAVGFTGIYAVKKKDSSTHTVTVATTSSQTIDGASTRLLSLQDDGIVVVSDGSNWFVWAIPYDAPGYTLPDATTSAIGGVEVDQTPGSGHPIAVTTPRIGAVLGIAPLDTTGKIPSAYIQTLGGSAAEAGRWTRNAGNPVLDATVMADQSCVQEPCVLYDGGEFKMWYRQGATTEAICYATSPDGSTWTKYGSNPVLGQGGSSISGPAAQPSIIKALGTYYCYYTEFGGSGNMRVATSTDGLAWTRHTGNVMSLISGSTSWGNRYVWQEASTWYMLAEANDAGGIWMIYLASSSDGITYTLLNSGNPLTSLRIVSGGCWGGPWMPTPQQIDGLYHLWYHASAVSGNLPSDIYHATSPDKITWTVVGGGPVLTHLGGVTYEFDQVADPHVLEVDGTTYLFYDGDNNVSVTAAIGLATFPGTLHELVSGAALPLTDPTTTEGDLLYRHSGALVRLPLGTGLSVAGGVLTATGGGSGELLMEDGVTAPPVPLETEDQSDWLYQG